MEHMKRTHVSNCVFKLDLMASFLPGGTDLHPSQQPGGVPRGFHSLAEVFTQVKTNANSIQVCVSFFF